jgi:hypothetical protein
MTMIVLMVIISLEVVNERWKTRQRQWAQFIVILLIEQQHGSKKWVWPRAQLLVIISLEATFKMEKKALHPKSLNATTQFIKKEFENVFCGHSRC